MMTRTLTLTCRKCGKVFSYKVGDAVMPKDTEFIKHPLCIKCRALRIPGTITPRKKSR